MKKWKQTGVAAMLAVMLTGGAAVSDVAVVHAGWIEAIAGGAIAMAQVSTVYSKMDDTDEGQNEMLKATMQQTGVYNNAAYQQRAQRILDTLSRSPLVKRTYKVYVNPDDEINAFMTLGRVMSVNKGTMDSMDDDELAYVMAHEVGHGEHKDIIHGLKKQVGLATAVEAAASTGGAGAIASQIAGNYLANQVFTMGQEKDADELGFSILADTPYNLGGAPASMEVIKGKYGDLYHEGLSQVLKPNNHPKTSNRITDNQQRIYLYSLKHVKIAGDRVSINGIPVYTATPSGRYTAEERANYVGGKLARLYHDGNGKINGARVEGSTVYIDNTSIVTQPSYSDAFMVAKTMNKAISDVSVQPGHQKKVKK